MKENLRSFSMKFFSSRRFSSPGRRARRAARRPAPLPPHTTHHTWWGGWGLPRGGGGGDGVQLGVGRQQRVGPAVVLLLLVPRVAGRHRVARPGAGGGGGKAY